MRGAPPVEIRVHRQGPWRAFVVTLVILTAGSITIWLASVEAGTAFKAALAVATLGACAAALATTVPFDLRLRWTGSSWALNRGGNAPTSEPLAGTLTVAIDLGSWMLLRFVGESARARTTWLPVRRGDVEGDWHALRCAVHAPRPLTVRTP